MKNKRTGETKDQKEARIAQAFGIIQPEKATAKPVRIYENKTTPAKNYNFSASIPGVQNTFWFDTRAQAEKEIVKRGFKVWVEVPTIRISQAEYAALSSCRPSTPTATPSGVR